MQQLFLICLEERFLPEIYILRQSPSKIFIWKKMSFCPHPPQLQNISCFLCDAAMGRLIIPSIIMF